MIIDFHCHIFTKRIVENIRTRPSMIKELRLNVCDAIHRLAPDALAESAKANDVDICLLLPTAVPDKVRTVNDRFIMLCSGFQNLRPAATLHPLMSGLSFELNRMLEYGITIFKFSSFSQKFDPLSPDVEAMLNQLEKLGQDRGIRLSLIFDTFSGAVAYFGANEEHLTTPSKLMSLVNRHQGINFIGAHMGGLLCDFDELRRSLIPARNLYLDTSNAAHTLKDVEFMELLNTHGPAHILFGTDWPWFVHLKEIPQIRSLLIGAGFNDSEQDAVFGKNAASLLGKTSGNYV